MPRLFVGIDIPSAIKSRLLSLSGGVPGARWQSEDQIHLTLRFIGDVETPLADDIVRSLSAITFDAFDIRLSGVGQFGDKRPHVLWAGVEENPSLRRLAAKVENNLQRTGLNPETRKYTPHVTLARLKNPPRQRVLQFLSNNGLFQSSAFLISEFHLYESHLAGAGAIYQIATSFPLTASSPDAGPSL